MRGTWNDGGKMVESIQSEADRETAAARLRAAGLSEDRVARLLERAIGFFATLSEISELDAILPEPALTWQPLERMDHDGVAR